MTKKGNRITIMVNKIGIKDYRKTKNMQKHKQKRLIMCAYLLYTMWSAYIETFFGKLIL